MGKRKCVMWAIGLRIVGAGGGAACRVGSAFGGVAVHGGGTGSGIGSTGVCPLWGGTTLGGGTAVGGSGGDGGGGVMWPGQEQETWFSSC